jgi:AcrR family transcriptional regulator
MSARAAATEATRRRIVEVASQAFLDEWYDDVTLRGIADAAGVALQTVVNHFGTKDAVYIAAMEHVSDTIRGGRSTEPGDLDAAVESLVAGYERLGDATMRTLALEGRVPAVAAVLDMGRRGHAEWVERIFARALDGLRGADRARRLAQLVVATDVYTWKLLRRDKGLSRRQTTTAMRELVAALHP